MSRWLLRLAWLLLALGGGATWGVAFGWLNPVHAPDLASLPDDFGSLRTLQIYSVDSDLLGEQPPDRFIYRLLGDEDGHTAELYVAWFERGRRWSGRPHNLETCYRADGWEAGPSRRLTAPDGAVWTAQEFSKPERSILVHHWIQQPGLPAGVSSPVAMLRRLLTPFRLRQDVASVYLQFPIDASLSDAEAARAAQALMTSIEDLWR